MDVSRIPSRKDPTTLFLDRVWSCWPLAVAIGLSLAGWHFDRQRLLRTVLFGAAGFFAGRWSWSVSLWQERRRQQRWERRWRR